jgi:hypothetical protein
MQRPSTMSAGLLQMLAVGACAGFEAAQGRPPSADERALISAALYETIGTSCRAEQRPTASNHELGGVTQEPASGLTPLA